MAGTNKSKLLPIFTTALIVSTAIVLYRTLVAFDCGRGDGLAAFTACLEYHHWYIFEFVLALAVAAYAGLMVVKGSAE